MKFNIGPMRFGDKMSLFLHNELFKQTIHMLDQLQQWAIFFWVVLRKWQSQIWPIISSCTDKLHNSLL